MGFLFLQNNKWVADISILLAFEVMARSLRCQEPYNHRKIKKKKMNAAV